MVPLGAEEQASLGYVSVLDQGARHAIVKAERIGFWGYTKALPNTCPF